MFKNFVSIKFVEGKFRSKLSRCTLWTKFIGPMVMVYGNPIEFLHNNTNYYDVPVDEYEVKKFWFACLDWDQGFTLLAPHRDRKQSMVPLLYSSARTWLLRARNSWYSDGKIRSGKILWLSVFCHVVSVLRADWLASEIKLKATKEIIRWTTCRVVAKVTLFSSHNYRIIFLNNSDFAWINRNVWLEALNSSFNKFMHGDWI